MKSLFVLLCISVLLSFSGCKNNSANALSPVDSMVQKVNDGRPYSYVFVTKNSGNEFYGMGYTPFKDVYAENGYVVVVSSEGSNNYYSLSNTLGVEIRKGDLRLKY